MRRKENNWGLHVLNKVICRLRLTLIVDTQTAIPNKDDIICFTHFESCTKNDFQLNLVSV